MSSIGFPRLVHESDGAVIIHKPHGVPFHRRPDGSREGILQLVRQGQLERQYEWTGPLYPVHRLDDLTSGALVLAKSRAAAAELAAAFRAQRVTKYYLALADRRPSRKQGSVSGDMRRGRRGSWLLARTAEAPAVTRFASAAVPGRRAGLRAFLLRPLTGRTHQLRVALKSLGSPVLGDARYGSAAAAAAEDRAYLHCAALRFALGGELVQCVVPPGEGLEFLTPEFLAVAEAWLPLGLAEERGAWFADSKLLRSEPPAGLG